MQGRALSPKLVSRLATTKKVADPAKLAAMYVKTSGKPQLKLANGRLVTLDPPEQPVAVTPAIRALTVAPSELAKYKPYYEAPSDEPLTDRPTLVGANVDHTSRQTAVKDQRGRGSCVAFAVASALESHLRWKGSAVQHDISEEHMFKMFKDSQNENCNAYGFWYHDAWSVLEGKKVCSESQQPYADPSQCVISSTCSTGAAYSWKSVLQIPHTSYPTAKGWQASNTKLLEGLLDFGFDIAIAVGVAGTTWDGTTPATGMIDVELYPNGPPVLAHGSHAMTIIGYHRPGGYFILKNSWGADWGRGGYARFSYDYMQTYATSGLVVIDAAYTPVLDMKSTTPKVAPAATAIKR